MTPRQRTLRRMVQFACQSYLMVALSVLILFASDSLPLALT